MVRLRLVLRGVSPLIVRTIEVPALVTLAVLNDAMLILFGWSGEHLHKFTIRAVGYSTDWVVNGEDSRSVTLDSLELRVGERFCWAYDFFADWNVDIRVEAVNDEPRSRISCLSGRRAGPPEWCGGHAGFRAWENAHSLSEYAECVVQLRDHVDEDGHPVDPFDLLDRLEALSLWVLRYRFDKAEVNGRLPTLEVPACVSSSKSG
jgi:Plasmid pRiA4b ORF-3-like protein